MTNTPFIVLNPPLAKDARVEPFEVSMHDSVSTYTVAPTPTPKHIAPPTTHAVAPTLTPTPKHITTPAPAAHVSVPTASVVVSHVVVPTPAVLRAMGVMDAVGWSPVLATACAANGITSRLRLAAFLANIMDETGNLSTLVENMNYDSHALLAVFPDHFTPGQAALYGRTTSHPADQMQIAEHAYGGRMGNGVCGSGDGWLYRGRGAIQLTGKYTYARFAKITGIPLDKLPALLGMRDGAAQSAAMFWRVSGCNAIADTGDITHTRRVVNGGLNGLTAVQASYARALSAIQGK